MDTPIIVRPFGEADASQVRDLFIRINRLLAPPHLIQAFEDYIAASLAEEIDRISDYYRQKQGGFWVTVAGDRLIGMFGLEAISRDTMELRRMYVDPDVRRRGLARGMLGFAEDECRRCGRSRIELSTSELQSEAMALYRASGYRLVREEFADTASNKTIGGGIRRYHFTKEL